jgi:F-type H+-transporting ATPase subunit epsilon
MSGPPTFLLRLTTPERDEPPVPVAAVDAPGEAGRFTVLAGHQPLLAALQPGLLRVRHADGRDEERTIGAGVLRVTADGVTILCEA